MQIKEINVSRSVCFNIGQQYSNEVLVIHFKGLPDLPNKYIYVKKDNYEKEVPLVGDLYVVSRPLTTYSGEVNAQIIARDPGSTPIALTPNFKMMIAPSNYNGIGEDESYPDDPNVKNYFVKIDEKLNSFEELANLVQTKLDNGEFVGPKGEKGDPGEKGEPGDVTEEYRDLANQIAQNASDAQTSATNAQTSESNAQKILDDTKTFANQTKTELNQIKTDTSALKDEANASAVNAKASETKAEEYANNLQNSTETISQLKEDLVANTKEDAKTKRSLSALWALNNGISYRFETDSEKAYKKQIPSGAKLGSVNKVGGKTIVMNQLIDPSRRDAEKIEFDESTKHFKYNDWNDIGVKYICKNINLIGGHKYYIYATDKVRYTILHLYGDSLKESFAGSNVAETEIKKIITATSNGACNLYFNRYMALPENVSYFDGCINLIDLTKMFGSGNEPSTTQEVEAMFPNDYYAYNEGELISMSVNDVIYTDTSSNQKSHQIPQSIQNLDGYGWGAGTAYNYVDFENKKYYKCVDRIDLGVLSWKDIGISYGSVYRYDAPLFKVGKAQENNVICSRFEKNIISTKDTECYNFHNEFRYLIIQSKIDNLDTFKSAMQGVYLYYELAEPIVTDISDIIGDTFQEPFEVESGGSLTFKNSNGDGYQVAVPSDIQYTVALSEVTA